MNGIEQAVHDNALLELLGINNCDEKVPMRMLKIKWHDDDYIATEWNSPSTVPVDFIKLIVHADIIQVFLSCRVIGNMTKSYFLQEFKEGRGYEYIEEWKTKHHHTMNKLNGKQILKITELLRSFGHGNN
jgi:hypothetical protein